MAQIECAIRIGHRTCIADIPFERKAFSLNFLQLCRMEVLKRNFDVRFHKKVQTDGVPVFGSPAYVEDTQNIAHSGRLSDYVS